MPNEFEVQNAQLQGLLGALSVEINKVCKPIGLGFALFIFPFYGVGKDQGMFYSSSASRADMLKVLTEFLEKQGAIGG